jgi:prolyl-tRNA synthetase
LGEDIVWRCPKCNSAKAFHHETQDDPSVSVCPNCGERMSKLNTIEVGHIFKLGTKYTQAMEANFPDAQGVLKPIIMGCYGIGVSRLISAIVEQNNDVDGIIWPVEVTPFQVVILPLDTTNAEIMQTAQDFYRELIACGVEVLFDDRNERAGVKFKDADLIGVPLSVVVGKKSIEEKKIELRTRKDKSTQYLPKDDVLKFIKSFLNKK